MELEKGHISITNIAIALIMLLSFMASPSMGWTPIEGGDHSDSNWTPDSGDTIAGHHTGIDTFRIIDTVYVKHHDSVDYGNLEIEANVIIIDGVLDANGAGYMGGDGGPSPPESFLRGGGNPGIAGEGNAGGCPGDSGSEGNETVVFDYRLWAGGGGAGGGRGGGYGGGGCDGANGGEGQGIFLMETYGGDGGSGGTGSGSCPDGIVYTYGTADGVDIFMGSGGGGAGSGGNSGNPVQPGASSGYPGGRGGNGGGKIHLRADSIHISGFISANGSKGGDGGEGGAGAQVLAKGDAAGGGGGGAGGGSGGGILIYSPDITICSTAVISANGGEGGRGGDLGEIMLDPGSTWGAGGDGGAGGGGGRIKIFYSESSYVNEGNVYLNGGNGGEGGSNNGEGSNGNPGCNGFPGIYSQRIIGAVVVTTDLHPEIPDSVLVNYVKYPAPYQTFIAPGESILIGVDYPPNPFAVGETRYLSDFVSWDDGGDTSHWVFPGTGDTIFVAQFNVASEYFCTVRKDPISDTLGTLTIDTAVFVGADSDSQSYWWAEGSVHLLSVSQTDSVDSLKKLNFKHWSDVGERSHFTSPIMRPEIFIAHYVAQFPVVIRKDPILDTLGFFFIDIDTFWGPASVQQEFWWDSASIHLTEGSTPDYINSFSRYLLTGYSGGLDTLDYHFTTPITGPDTFTALYTLQHLCTIAKNPTTNRFGLIALDGDTIMGYASTHQERWWDHGSVHSIEASTIDTVDIGEAWVFTEWSDGLPPLHLTYPIAEPCTLTAFYDYKYQVIVRKDPPVDSCGWLAINSATENDTFYGTESVEQEFWLEEAWEGYFSVSDTDNCPDLLYNFFAWSTGFTNPGSLLVTVAGGSTFVAYYRPAAHIISIWVSDTTWFLDTMNLGETRSMADSEHVMVGNESTTFIDLGLAIIDCPGWEPGLNPEDDQFSLRARFQNLAPASYTAIDDFLYYTPHRWSTPETFGPEGFDMQYEPPDTVGLWFQFLTPTTGHTAYGDRTIHVNIVARAAIP
ncbi:hypothetical protein JXI42_10095 [bacterium]|nr:hypothetical protein [bacterium]